MSQTIDYKKLFDPDKRYFVDTDFYEHMEAGISELIVVHPCLEKDCGHYRWALVPEAESSESLVFHVYRPFKKNMPPTVYAVWYHDMERRLASAHLVGDVSCVHEFDSIDKTFDEMMEWLE